MTPQEWLIDNGKMDKSAKPYEPIMDAFQQYAEYFHAEKMKQVGNDAEQAANKLWTSKEFSGCQLGKSDFIGLCKQIWQSKPSDAVEFAEWLHKGNWPASTEASKTYEQLYSQFQNRDNENS